MSGPDVSAIVRALSEGEKSRLLEGRYDWRDDAWQDHCGELGCEHCEGSLIPEGRPYALSSEDTAVSATLLAEIERIEHG